MTTKRLFWLSVAIAVVLTAIPDLAQARQLIKEEPGFKLPLTAVYAALVVLLLYAMSETKQ